MQETDELVQHDLETVLQAKRAHRRPHLNQVVVGVGAPDVDLAIQAALGEAQPVIRDVLSEVRRLAAGANDHPSLFVLDLIGRVEPHRSVLLVDLAALPQRLHRVLEIAGAHHLRLREPAVETDPELLAHALVLADHPLHAERREDPRLLLERQAAEALALARQDRARDIRDVLALISLRRQRRVLAQELAVPDRDGLSEHVELRAAVLDVELAGHIGAEEGEHAPERVPERAAARVGEMQRSGRIRRNELDLDPLARKDIGASIPIGRTTDLVGLTGDPLRPQPQIDEAFARDLGAGDDIVRRQPADGRFRDLLR